MCALNSNIPLSSTSIICINFCNIFEFSYFDICCESSAFLSITGNPLQKMECWKLVLYPKQKNSLMKNLRILKWVRKEMCHQKKLLLIRNETCWQLNENETFLHLKMWIENSFLSWKLRQQDGNFFRWIKLVSVLQINVSPWKFLLNFRFFSGIVARIQKPKRNSLLESFSCSDRIPFFLSVVFFLVSFENMKSKSWLNFIPLNNLFRIRIKTQLFVAMFQVTSSIGSLWIHWFVCINLFFDSFNIKP